MVKTPKGREVAPTDTFAFNEGFTCPLARIKILQVAAARVETGKEREETEGMVEEERRFQVEVSLDFEFHFTQKANLGIPDIQLAVYRDEDMGRGE